MRAILFYLYLVAGMSATRFARFFIIVYQDFVQLFNQPGLWLDYVKNFTYFFTPKAGFAFLAGKYLDIFKIFPPWTNVVFATVTLLSIAIFTLPRYNKLREGLGNKFKNIILHKFKLP